MTSNNQTKKLLLVEDEGIIALSESRMLQKYGYEVLTVSNGEDAIETIQSSPEIDMVLMDINLGSGMDGTQAAEIILEQRDLPLVFLSSHTDPDVVEKTEGITSYGYVVKGAGETVLNASIKMAFRLFESKKREQEHELALQKSEERFRKQFESTPVPTFIWQYEQQQFLLFECNLAADKLTQGMAKKFIGLSAEQIYSDRADLLELFYKCLKEQKIVVYETDYHTRGTQLDRTIIFTYVYVNSNTVMLHTEDITERKKTEEKLLQSERQLRLITDTLPAYVAYVGLDDLRYRFVNNRFEQSYSIPREQIIGSHIKNIIGQSNYEFAQKYLDIVRKGKATSYENSFVTAGTERWVNVNYVPEINDDGEVEAVVVLSFDITDRKQADNKLKEREERLQLIFDTMTEGVALNEIIYDENGEMVDYRILEVNKAFYSVANLLDKNVIGNVATKLYGMTSGFIKAFWEEHKEKESTAYAEMFRSDSNKWFAISTSPFYEDKFVTSFVDITESKQTQEQLRFQANLLDVIEQAVVVTDVTGRIIYWNPFAERLIGWTAEEAVGRTTIDIIDSEQSQQQAIEILVNLQAGQIWSGEYPIRHRDGTLFHSYTTITPGYNDQGELSYFIGISSDISKLKKEENALKKSEEKFRLAMEATRDGLWDWNILNGDVYYSPGWAKILGENQVPFEFRTWEDRLHPDDLPLALSTVQEHLDGKTEYWHLEHRLRAKDGKWKWVYGRGKVITRDNSGKALRMVGTMTDITNQKQTEEALLESKEYIEHLNNAMADALITVNLPAREIEYVNTATEKIFGYSAEECVGQKTLIFYADDHVYFDFGKKLSRAIEQGKDVLHVEQVLKRKNGELFTAEITTTFLRESDRITKVISIMRDISRNVEIEKELLEKEQQYQAIIQTAMEGFWIADTQGQLLEVNETYCQMSGYSRQELLSMSIPDLDVIEKSANTAEHIHKIIANGQDRFESRHRRKDGSVYDIEVSTQYHPERGGLFVAFLRDISERKLAEENLRKSEERFKDAFQHSPIGMALVSTEGKWLQVNSKVCSIVGYSEDELLRTTFQDITYPEDLNIDMEYVRQMLAGEIRTYSMEKRYFHKNGKIIWVVLAVSLVRDENGVPLYFISQIEDITTRKQSEYALQKAVKEKQNLLRELQHRAKNSFAMITSLTSLMTETTQSKEAISLLNELGARVRAMAQLYDLLYVTETVTETQLDEYFAKIMASFPSPENIRYEQSYESVFIPVKTAASLGLILTELITNANKHAFPENRPGTISIALHKTRTGAQLEVNDDGIGLPENFDMSASKSLGLMIVSSLAREIHGVFQLKSVQGTQCIVGFPITTNDE